MPWLLREAGSGTRETLEALLEAVGGDGPRFTLGSNGAVIAGAEAALGATLASREVVAADIAAGRLVEVPLPGTPLDRPFHLVGRRDLSATARLFVAHVHASGEWELGDGRGEGEVSSPTRTPPGVDATTEPHP